MSSSQYDVERQILCRSRVWNLATASIAKKSAYLHKHKSNASQRDSSLPKCSTKASRGAHSLHCQVPMLDQKNKDKGVFIVAKARTVWTGKRVSFNQ